MPRIKDDHKNHNHVLEGISPELKAFNDEFSAVFPGVRYTSGKRNASDKVGKYSAVSHHNTGNALDFGAEHKKEYEWLTGTKEGLQLLTKHGLGIIDETNPETMKKTGATGPHYHIGKDSKYVKQAQDMLLKFDKETPVVTQTQYQSTIVPIQTLTPVSLNFVDPNVLENEVKLAQERENITEKKIEESPERQAIRKKQEERQAILDMVKPNEIVNYYDGESQDTGIPISQIEMQPVQTQLSELPSIFNLPPID